MDKMPAPEKILQIISATGFKATFGTEVEGEFDSIPLTAWVFLRDGGSIPMIYDLESKNHVNAYAVQGFVQITHEDFLEDETEDLF